MTLKLHWFLPTTGDGRTLVGGGHSVPKGIGVPAGHAGSANRRSTKSFMTTRPGICLAALNASATCCSLAIVASLSGSGVRCRRFAAASVAFSGMPVTCDQTFAQPFGCWFAQVIAFWYRFT